MSNQFAASLYRKSLDRFSIDSLSMPMSEWIEKNTTLKKRPFTFGDYAFQRKIADDMHQNLNVIKISQVGLTEIQIRKALGFLVRNRGTSLIFSLPDEVMYERVSKARVKPIVNEDKVFNTASDATNKVVRSTEMMQFDQSFLYLVPALESAATSISADFVMNDEVDLSDQKMISLFNSRLQASKFQISQKFSTPSFPSYGIDLNWKVSDQHLWMCRCDGCGHVQHPEFDRRFVHLPGVPDHIEDLTHITVEFQELLDFDNAYVKCEKCHHPLDLRADNRFWLSQYPSRKETRGYRVGPFSTGALTIRYIFRSLWEYQKNSYLRGFHNTVLGMPYSDGSIQIPEVDIVHCMTSNSLMRDLSEYENLWIGVDMGQTCHVTIGSGPHKDSIDIIGIYPMPVEKIVEHLAELCEKFKVRGGCVDRFPYTPTANDIFKATKGKIIPVEYRGQKELNLVYDEYEQLSHAQVNRTLFLDEFASRIRKHLMTISGYGHYKQAFIDHLRDMVRNESPEKQAEWIKLQGNDHFFHSSAFMLLAPHLKEIAYLHTTPNLNVSVMHSTVVMKQPTSTLAGARKKTLDVLGQIG